MVSTRHGSVVEPLPLVNARTEPPRGHGNAKSLDAAVLSNFADEVVRYLRAVESEFAVSIERVAIDAPSDPRLDGARRRACEIALDTRRISCITTPSAEQFLNIRDRALRHLSSGGAEARLPAANQLWMLVGFALFARLRREWDCLEVFPQAIAAVLKASAIHKRHDEGLRAQLKAASHHTGWPNPPEPAALSHIAYGQPHDRLDAYLSSWIASLPQASREALGAPPNDAIWIPRLGSGS